MNGTTDNITIAFAGGGTGGHIYPGLAVIEALRERGFPGRIVWIGSKKPQDRAIVEAAGIEYFPIPSGKLRRSLDLENLADGFRVIMGFFAARRILSSIRPAILFSKGGYVSVPPCKAAASLRIPYITHESDASPGLATRLNAAGAELILTSWPETGAMFPENLRAKVLVTGNPVRPSVLKGDAGRGRKLCGAPEGMPIVFFIGGSLGARQINDIAKAALPGLEGKAFVVHQTGREHFDPKVHASVPGSYFALPYARDEMRDLLAAATVVAGRAGAGSIGECAALGKPMVLIPLCGRGTRGDQVENAKMAAKAGAAACLAGEDATPEAVVEALLRFIENPAEREKAAAAALSLSRAKARDNTEALSADFIAALVMERVMTSPGGKR